MREFTIDYVIVRNDIPMNRSQTVFALDCEDAKVIFRDITEFFKEIKSIKEVEHGNQ